MAGEGRTRALVAAACGLSLAAYVAFSQELRFQLRDGAYRHSLLRELVHQGGVETVRRASPTLHGGLVTLLFVAACALAGEMLRRAFRGASGATEAIAFAVAAAVVPAMALATVWWPDGRGLLDTAHLVAGALVVAAAAGVRAWRVRGARAAVPRAPEPRDERREGLGWAIVLAASLVLLLLVTWWNGVTALRGFDSLADHLPRAARWLRLSRLTDESGPLLTPYYPGNFQLLLRWALAIGTDVFAFAPSLIAAMLCLAALYAIGRELGQSRRLALVSMATAASCTLLPQLAATAEADTTTTACLLGAVLLLLRWRRLSEPVAGDGGRALRDLAPLAAMGTLLGLAVGTKYSAIPPALVIAAAAAWVVRRRSRTVLVTGDRVINARTLVILAATIVVPMVAGAGYWLLRNLVQHGNPFYPVSELGLPGVPMRYIIPVKPALTGDLWHRVTYPWVQWGFTSELEDGLGAAFGSVALVALLVMAVRRAPPGSPRRLLWWVTLGSFATWLGTGSITARFGLFPLLLSFAFVGELWRELGSVALRAVTVAAALLGIACTAWSLASGAVYSSLRPAQPGAVLAVVDTLPPARIFNATPASNRYALLGRDYRHEVVTMFGAATVADRDSSRARYMLLTAPQVPALAAGWTLVVSGVEARDTVSLWKSPSASH